MFLGKTSVQLGDGSIYGTKNEPRKKIDDNIKLLRFSDLTEKGKLYYREITGNYSIPDNEVVGCIKLS